MAFVDFYKDIKGASTNQMIENLKRTLGMFELDCTKSKKTSIESNETFVELLMGSSYLL